MSHSGTPPSSQIIWLEQRVRELEAKIEDLLSVEHSVPELRNQLQDAFADKQKCQFAVAQYQKANHNLLKENIKLRTKVSELQVFRDMAFMAHPNIDIDIEQMEKRLQND